MIIQNLFVRHKVPQPRFAPALFIGLLAMFSLLGQAKPVFGLVGLGTVSILAAALVELNRERIWEGYRKAYRQQKGARGLLTRPNPMYYTINVLFLWPFILFLGVVCLYAAYLLS
jgi:hypothetical protein